MKSKNLVILSVLAAGLAGAAYFLGGSSKPSGAKLNGKRLAGTTLLQLKDVGGKEIASVTMGEKHPKWGHGRYLGFEGETVLVTDTLDAFDGDPKRWIDTKIVDNPRISFNDLADKSLAEADFGFATGIVAKVEIAGDTNRVMTVGNPVKNGNGRYVKLDNVPWIFEVPDYSVEKFLPKSEPEKSEK